MIHIVVVMTDMNVMIEKIVMIGSLIEMINPKTLLEFLIMIETNLGGICH